LFFREDSRLVRRPALKPHSARHGLGSKTVEQELTEGTEVSLISVTFCSMSLVAAMPRCDLAFINQRPSTAALAKVEALASLLRGYREHA
jgi:hypothetical protein